MVPRASAEWFSTLILYNYLAQYQGLRFGPAYTHLSGTDTATISGTTHTIGNFTHLYRFTEKDYARPGLTAATTSSLTAGTSFVITWKGY
jgi:hypothetical protein